MPRKTPRRNPMDHFPAKPRKDGRFQKRINGVLYYFGANGDRAGALKEYDGAKWDLYAGRKPRPSAGVGAMAMREISNRFLFDRKSVIEPGTYTQHRRALRRFVKWLGAGRAATDIMPDDFAEYGRRLRKKLGSYAFNRERAAILAALNHAEEQGWIDRAPKLGAGFKRVPKSKMRGERKSRLLSGPDVNALLGVAGPNLFAMILLGLNGGLGAEDCSAFPWVAIDFVKAVADYARTKNNISRTIPLWPETVDALKVLRARRPHDTLVFRTKSGGRWRGNTIAHAFRKLCKAARVPLTKGVGLGACRHTFATYANEARDTDARRHILGRLLPNLDDIYVETLFHVRLRKVVDHVHQRLLISDIIGNRGKIPPIPA